MLGVDPEAAVHRACEKAIGRFRHMETLAAGMGKNLECMSLSEMEALHQMARQEREGKAPSYDKMNYFRELENKQK